MGVQSFDDSLLKQMDRYDKYGSAEEILERLQWVAGRFHSLNVDMIFNFPSQTAEMLMRDVEMLKASGTNQTTFYPLMASPAVEASLKAHRGRGRLRARGALLPACSPTPCRTRSSRRAAGRSRARAAG